MASSMSSASLKPRASKNLMPLSGMALWEADNMTPRLAPWRTVRGIAHDIVGHASTFGYTAAAAIAASLERLVQPAVSAPGTLVHGTVRRLRAAQTHAKALALILDQGIVGRSEETDALVARLERTVDRVHRDAAA